MDIALIVRTTEEKQRKENKIVLCVYDSLFKSI